MNKLKIGDRVQIEFEVREGDEMYPYYLHPVRVDVNNNTTEWESGEDAIFTTDGRYLTYDNPILELEDPVTLESITAPFTIVDLNDSRMCLIGGQWTFSSGEVMDDGVYAVLKESEVTVVFDPLKQN